MSANSDNWADSFEEFGSELLNLSTYGSIINQERNQKFREMTVWSIFGVFSCKTCSNRWTSTKCSVLVMYRYNVDANLGEVNIKREFRQDCRKCEESAAPLFDLEATDKAVSKIVDRIKKVFYNICAPGNVEADPHSRASARKTPHDSARCEACKLGVCNFNEDDNFRPQFRYNRPYTPSYSGARSKIGWSLTFEGEVIKVLASHGKSSIKSSALGKHHRPSPTASSSPWKRTNSSDEGVRPSSSPVAHSMQGNRQSSSIVATSRASVASAVRVATAVPSNVSGFSGEAVRCPTVNRVSLNEASSYATCSSSAYPSYASTKESTSSNETFSYERIYAPAKKNKRCSIL